MNKIVIVGAGALAKEILWLINDINNASPKWDFIGFLDLENNSDIKDQPLLNLNQFNNSENIYAVIAIGSPNIKKKVYEELKHFNFKYAKLIHPNVVLGIEVSEIGEGSIICAGSIISVDIKFGKHVTINLSNTIGHDCELGDFVTISPGCHLSGFTKLKNLVFLGTGVITIPNILIDTNTTIGAGSTLFKNIPSNVIAFGNPARVSRKL